MIYSQNKVDLPVWINDVNDPQWTEKVISYYEDSFIIPRKTYDVFFREICDSLDLEEYCSEAGVLSFPWGEEIKYDKAWLVIRNEKSEQYYRFVDYGINAHSYFFPEQIIIFYREEDPFMDSDLFFSNNRLLSCALTISRGIDQKDIDGFTRSFFHYFTAFLGYHLALADLKKEEEEVSQQKD